MLKVIHSGKKIHKMHILLSQDEMWHGGIRHN